LPDVNEAIFKAGGLAYDLAYADQPTSFMRWAVVSGAGLAVDGLGMLVEQAAESFFIWHQKRPQTLPVIDELRAGFR
jgi:shikimate dehydrogenase